MFPGVFILWDYMATPIAGGCHFLEEEPKSGGACGAASMDSQISSFLAGERENESISGTPLTAVSCSHLYNPFQ